MSDAGQPVEAGQDGEIAYADALAELEEILDSLEADQVDVDTLASQVERAAVLVRLCRARLAAARVHVEAIVEDLDDGTDGA